MFPMYLSERYKVETEGNGARVLVTRLKDGATLFLQDESAVVFLDAGQPWVSMERGDWHISQYDEVFAVPAAGPAETTGAA